MKFRTIENLREIMVQSAKSVLKFNVDLKIAIWLKAFIYSMAEGLFSLQTIIKDAVLQLFPQTARGEFLSMFGDWEGVPKLVATPSRGFVVFTADVAGDVIPEDTQIQAQNGVIYNTQEEATIAEVYTVIDSFVIAGGIATVTTETAHQLASGQTPELDIYGLGLITPDSITVIDSKTFVFQTELSNIITDGTMTNYFAVVPVESDSQGFIANQDSGAFLNIIDTLSANIGEQAIVGTGGLKGGVDAETEEAYRSRIKLSRAQMRGVFTDDQNILAGLRIAGNSQIVPDIPKVGNEELYKVAGFQPRAGEAVFYVIRRLEDGTIEDPVGADVLAETKESIIEFGKLPSHMSADDVHVFGALLYPVDIELQITPDNATNRNAVTNSVKAFFEDNEGIGTNPSLNGLVSAINNTPKITSFSLIQPTGIIVPDKYIATAGTITFI